MEDNNSSTNEQKQNQDKQTPHDLFKKHLSDPSHNLTEEEMKNLETKPEADPDFERKEKEKLDELTKEIGKHPLNPYDILDNE